MSSITQRRRLLQTILHTPVAYTSAESRPRVASSSPKLRQEVEVEALCALCGGVYHASPDPATAAMLWRTHTATREHQHFVSKWVASQYDVGTSAQPQPQPSIRVHAASKRRLTLQATDVVSEGSSSTAHTTNQPGSGVAPPSIEKSALSARHFPVVAADDCTASAPIVADGGACTSLVSELPPKALSYSDMPSPLVNTSSGAAVAEREDVGVQYTLEEPAVSSVEVQTTPVEVSSKANAFSHDESSDDNLLEQSCALFQEKRTYRHVVQCFVWWHRRWFLRAIRHCYPTNTSTTWSGSAQMIDDQTNEGIRDKAKSVRVEVDNDSGLGSVSHAATQMSPNRDKRKIPMPSSMELRSILKQHQAPAPPQSNRHEAVNNRPIATNDNNEAESYFARVPLHATRLQSSGRRGRSSGEAQFEKPADGTSSTLHQKKNKKVSSSRRRASSHSPRSSSGGSQDSLGDMLNLLSATTRRRVTDVLNRQLDAKNLNPRRRSHSRQPHGSKHRASRESTRKSHGDDDDYSVLHHRCSAKLIEEEKRVRREVKDALWRNARRSRELGDWRSYTAVLESAVRSIKSLHDDAEVVHSQRKT